MAEYRRLGLSLNPDNELHRRAWRILLSIPPGQRTTAVCEALIQREGRECLKSLMLEDREQLKPLLRELLLEVLRDQPHSNDTEQPNKQETAEADQEIYAFLRGLQEGADFFE